MPSEAEPRGIVSLSSMEVIRARVAATLFDAARTTTGELPGAEQTGRAAVALVLREADDGPQILLIRRAERSGDPWSGHMAFPGGREDARDESLLATALRETREELSLDLLHNGRVLGQLELLPAIARGKSTGMVIAPFVFELTGDAQLAYKLDEVAEAIWVPIDPLMRGNLRTTFPYQLGEQNLELPAHSVDGRIVWGLTYRMLESLFALLRDTGEAAREPG